MLHQMIRLKEQFKVLGENGSNPTLTSYIPDTSPEIESGRKRPSVVICPGGGYGFISDREGEPVALRFMAAGYNAFVLHYSIAPARYPQQLLEVSAAVAYIRRMAEQWHVDADQIAVCGFSAGGHLAGNLGVSWNQDFIAQALGLRKEENKPNKLILSYPVITSGAFAHRGSFENLLGSDASEEMLACVALENCVTPDTPETFIWHTFEDAAVPVQNSLLFANAMSAQAIPFELHIYPEGGHGLSLCDSSTAAPDAPYLIQPHVGTWFKLVLEWLAK